MPVSTLFVLSKSGIVFSRSIDPITDHYQFAKDGILSASSMETLATKNNTRWAEQSRRANARQKLISAMNGIRNHNFLIARPMFYKKTTAAPLNVFADCGNITVTYSKRRKLFRFVITFRRDTHGIYCQSERHLAIIKRGCPEGCYDLYFKLKGWDVYKLEVSHPHVYFEKDV